MRKVHAALWRWRYLLGALTVFAIVAAALSGLSGLRPAEASVVVAATDLSPGERLRASDLQLAKIPAALVPSGAITDPAALDGKVITTPVPSGMPLSEGVVLGTKFLKSAPPGQVVVPVSIVADGTDEVAKPGVHIALFALPGTGATAPDAKQIVADATVVGLGPRTSSGSFITGEKTARAQIFVAIPAQYASLVVGYGATASLRAVLVSPARPTP